MEALHRAEMGEVSNHEAPGESEDEEVHTMYHIMHTMYHIIRTMYHIIHNTTL